MKAVKQNTNEDSRAGPKRIAGRPKSNPLSPPTTIEIRGVQVHFPFRPYNCQVDYMEKVMDALLRSENALLESPTGTGKTLCLLCATLAWQREQSRLLSNAVDLNDSKLEASACGMSTQDGPNKAAQVPTIIYASRTHSQLSQVVRELRNTRYRPRHALLGSREQMCVNPKVKKAHSSSSEINHDCNTLSKERRCRFRNNLEGFTPPSNETGSVDTQPVMDMEDLIMMGKSLNVCPFYYTRANVDNAELILMPYNYLFDKDARESTLGEIPWKNSVVIFDEAHNLEAFASDSASFDLTSMDVASCISDVQRVIQYMQVMPDLNCNVKSENLIRLKAIFLQLEDFMSNLSSQTTYEGPYMIEIFRQGAGITHANHAVFVEEVRKVNDLIMDMRGTGATRGSAKLEHFITCIKRVFAYKLESRCLAKASCYRVYVTPNIPGNHKAGRTISYWCFAPSLAMEELAALNVRSIVVTSGTLSPLQSYSMELGLAFPITLENPHIISDAQIHVQVIGNGPSGKQLTSSFERRKDGDYYSELGNTLLSLAKVIPAGMLIFFPSYSVMETCFERWGGPCTSRQKYSDGKNNFFAPRRRTAVSQNSFPFTALPSGNGSSNTWERLLCVKSIVVEPKGSGDLSDAMSDFRRYLGTPKSPGCILMGVCRGKISEGIDFAHEMSRAVVITGIPFPPSHDPKVQLKRVYLDKQVQESLTKHGQNGGFDAANRQIGKVRLSGHEWYSQQAHRAVNQAIGRVIRNRADYGAVLLLDARFDQIRNQEGLSKWVRPHIRKDEGFGSALKSLASFFNSAEEAVKAVVKLEADLAAQSAEEASVPLRNVSVEDDASTGNMVALVRQESLESGSGLNHGCSEDGTGSNLQMISAYFRPQNVLARIDVSALPSSSNDIPTSVSNGKAVSNRHEKYDDVFGVSSSSNWKPLKAQTNSVSKAVAVRFMEKVKLILSAPEQSVVHKAVVAMKSFGEKKEMRSYQAAASQILDIIIRNEPFEEVKDRAESMLFLFFQLLPDANKKDVQMVAMKTVFGLSKLGSLCRERLPSSIFAKVATTVSRLLYDAWCTKDGLTKEAFVGKTNDLFRLFHSNGGKHASWMERMYGKLIPAQYDALTFALSQELADSKGIVMVKQAEQANRGEISIDLTRFVPSKSCCDALSDKCSDPTAQSACSKPLKQQVGQRPNPSNPCESIKRASINPYSRKRPVASDTTSSAVEERPTLALFIKTVECSPFVKRKASDVAAVIKSNFPGNIQCPICDSLSKEPFIAECGHAACLQCWLGWLKRSETCPTCRRHTKKEALARAILAPRSGVPTSLSQLCASGEAGDKDDQYDDEELVIEN